MKTKFELRGYNIHYTQTGKLICSVRPENQASEERIEGESWLDMYNRTAPERAKIKAQTEKRAASICNFLNSSSARGSINPVPSKTIEQPCKT